MPVHYIIHRTIGQQNCQNLHNDRYFYHNKHNEHFSVMRLTSECPKGRGLLHHQGGDADVIQADVDEAG